MTYAGSDVRLLFLVLTVAVHNVVRYKYTPIKNYLKRCKNCPYDIWPLREEWNKYWFFLHLSTFVVLKWNARILPVLMNEVYFNWFIDHFKSLHCDPKRDKFHSNDPVFQFMILEFSEKNWEKFALKDRCKGQFGTCNPPIGSPTR